MKLCHAYVVVLLLLLTACSEPGPDASSDARTSEAMNNSAENGTGTHAEPVWAAAWGAALFEGRKREEVSNQTLRFIVRPQYSGNQVRIRVSNTYGEESLVLDAVWLGNRQHGPTIIPETNVQLAFNGNASVTIPAGGSLYSDPVNIDVRAFEELAISLYIAGFRRIQNWHANALATSYIADGNQAGNELSPLPPLAYLGESYPFQQKLSWVAWVDLIEVHTRDSSGVIVAFGDSITDGDASCNTNDTYDTWPDQLSRRLYEESGRGKTAYKSVINMGIAGNTVNYPGLVGTPGVDRFKKDALSVTGVSDVIVWLGSNDLVIKSTKETVLGGLQYISELGRKNDLNMVAVTMIPRKWNGFRIFDNDQQERDSAKNTINRRLRAEDLFDAYIDADKILKDIHGSDVIAPRFNCDFVHPNALGLRVFSESIDLSLF